MYRGLNVLAHIGRAAAVERAELLVDKARDRLAMCADDQVDVRPARVEQTWTEDHAGQVTLAQVAAEATCPRSTDHVPSCVEQRGLHARVSAERRQVTDTAAGPKLAVRAILRAVEDHPPDGARAAGCERARVEVHRHALLVANQRRPRAGDLDAGSEHIDSTLVAGGWAGLGQRRDRGDRQPSGEHQPKCRWHQKW